MSKKGVVIIVYILCIVLSFGVVFATRDRSAEEIPVLEKQIAENMEVKTYKNTVPMYERLIEIEPQNMKWYTGLADAYKLMDRYADYKTQCERIQNTFPQDREGYIRLMRYYESAGEYKKLVEYYNSMPEAMRNDEEMKQLFNDYRWNYRYISDSFDHIYPYTGQSYLIETGGLYGQLSSSGDALISCRFEQAGPLIGDKAGVCMNGEWYIIDSAGDRIGASLETYDYIGTAGDGVSLAKKNGKYGYVDAKFNEYAFLYDDATYMINGLAAVCKNGKWGIINNKFETIVDFTYDDVIRDVYGIASRGGIMFLVKNGQYSAIQSDGSTAFSEKYDQVQPFFGGYAAVCRNGKWGFVNAKGKVVLELEYEDASSCNGEICCVCRDGKWGAVDMNGNIVVPFEFESTFIGAATSDVIVRRNNRDRIIRFIVKE